MGKGKKFELDKLQQKTLLLFASSSLSKRFYWTGGTALTYLHLQHRRSEDIDLFSDTAFSHNELLAFIGTVRQHIKLKNIEEKRIFDRHEFFLHNDSTLRLEFVHYEFPALQRRKKWNDIYVDSLTDMAANKTMAMLDRHDPKDAFDVYFLIHVKNFTPKKLLSLVKKKFGITYPESSFWSQGLIAAKMLKNIQPLMTEKNFNLKKIQLYFEAGSVNQMRRFLD